MLAITAYPLSDSFRQQLELSLGAAPEYVAIPQLRRLPLGSMITRMRALSADGCVLVLEDPDSLALLPIMHSVASLARPWRIEVIRPDLSRRRLHIWSAPGSILDVARQSAWNALAARFCRRQLRRLLSAPPIAPGARSGRRILYLNGNLWFGLKAGGSVTHMAGVANGLCAAGYVVEMASLVKPPLLARGVSAHRLAPPRSLGMPYDLNKYGFQRSIVQQLESTVAWREQALIYERLSISTYAGAVLSRAHAIPLVLEYNGSEVWTSRHWGTGIRDQSLALMAEDVQLRHAHLLVTVSTVLRDELVERGVKPERIVCHPNGVDPAVFNGARFGVQARLALRREHGIAADAVLVGFIGTFGQWHGVEVLAQAITALARTDAAWIERNRLHFLLVGDGVQAPRVDEILSATPGADRWVTRTGLVGQSEAPAYLAACDVLASPHVPNPDGSPFFGSPTKLFEYMSMAGAIVASRLDQIADVLTPSLDAARLPEAPPARDTPEVAVLAEPGSVEELVRGIRFLVEQPRWRELLGANARRELLARYTWEHHVAAILERLGELDLVVPA